MISVEGDVYKRQTYTTIYYRAPGESSADDLGMSDGEKQKTAYEMRESDWSSDVCSSDLIHSAVRMKGLSNSPNLSYHPCQDEL